MAIQLDTGDVQSQAQSWIYRAQLALLRGDRQTTLEAAESALQLAEETISSTQFVYPVRHAVWAHWLLGAARCDMGHLVDAEAHLSEALIRCRQINLVELEPDILLTWAGWHLASGDREQSRQVADEALSIASRSEYRLKQAEIHAFLARWELEAGNAAEASKQAERARECAWCDGPPHCYKPALDRADELLAQSRKKVGARSPRSNDSREGQT